jgi:hypothetical protein
MLRSVALVRTDVSEELSTSIISMTRIGELGTTFAVTSNRCTLRRNTYTNTNTRATRHNIRENGIFQYVIGIATGYGLDDRGGVSIRVPLGSKIFKNAVF